jgi:hypothetical protein
MDIFSCGDKIDDILKQNPDATVSLTTHPNGHTYLTVTQKTGESVSMHVDGITAPRSNKDPVVLSLEAGAKEKLENLFKEPGIPGGKPPSPPAPGRGKELPPHYRKDPLHPSDGDSFPGDDESSFLSSRA